MTFVLAYLLAHATLLLIATGGMTRRMARQVTTLRRQLDEERLLSNPADQVIARRNALLGLGSGSGPFSRN